MAVSENQKAITPVILSGGAGTRLWPRSRALHPKQLLPLVGDQSLLQQTAERVADRARFRDPIVVCNEAHRFIVAEQLREIEASPAELVLEPVGRNTAPAAAVAANIALLEDSEAFLLILPSDHHIERPDVFLDSVELAMRAAQLGHPATFGINPNRAETGYGYLEPGDPIEGAPGVRALASFVEKPDPETAERLIATGHLWNAGIFLFRATDYIAALNRFEPAIAEAAATATAAAKADHDFLRLDPSFENCPSKSIDYAVMERIEGAAVVPADLGWSDLGSWRSLWESAPKDDAGNVRRGDVMTLDAAGNYLDAGGRLLAAVGLRDMVVVVTNDAVLVAPKDRDQDVRTVVERLDAMERPEAALHPRVYRPWGYYQAIDAGDRFQVKRIAVYPGRALSLQKHAHRAEHWVVVDGTAIVTRDEEQFELRRNESTFIPLGAVHRLENPGPDLLKLIEVQSGDYLGEDDIVRLEDDFGRARG